MMVVTAVALVVPLGGPALAGFSVTVTLAGEIIPLGKFDPLTLRLVRLAWPAVGEVEELSVTVTPAQRSGRADDTKLRNRTRKIICRSFISPLEPR
jgi:hypothetical protein